MITQERQRMSILGVAVTKEKNKTCYYVEYHQCDRCGVEYRVYYRSEKNMNETLAHIRNVEVGREIVSQGKEDLCFHCLNATYADQALLLLEA